MTSSKPLPSTKYPITVEDQLGFSVTLSHAPQRIVSLVPSITSTLFDLGLEGKIVGRTKFCIHPKEKINSVPIIGGTKNLNIPKIKSLQPDLFIANKEENKQSQIEFLQQHYNVWITDIVTLSDNYNMIEQIGRLTDCSFEAKQINQEINQNFKSLTTLPRQNVAYFIWRAPFMVAGHHTFINSILETIGLNNIFKAYPGRYPKISLEQLKQASPELILLSSEPYPFKQNHIDEFKQIVPTAKIILVDGEMFSWYGSKMIKAPSYYSNQLKSQL
ncbi:MAG: ABC transporter substrate-binding protein [Bacteroidetes bacterium]|nr:ABC transporter substrate-binding protein [Bacteroidota bacterium]